MTYYCEDKEQVLQALNTSSEKGLSVAEAEKRLAENGKNKLAEGKKKSLFVRFLEQFADPMTLILIAAAVISGVLSIVDIANGKEGEFVDVIIIMAVVIINAILGVFQESKAEKAIEALQEMSAATSKVLRDGKVIHVPSEELVVGAIILRTVEF